MTTEEYSDVICNCNTLLNFIYQLRAFTNTQYVTVVIIVSLLISSIYTFNNNRSLSESTVFE